jgi:hypothetical protein
MIGSEDPKSKLRITAWRHLDVDRWRVDGASRRAIGTRDAATPARTGFCLISIDDGGAVRRGIGVRADAAQEDLPTAAAAADLPVAWWADLPQPVAGPPARRQRQGAPGLTAFDTQHTGLSPQWPHGTGKDCHLDYYRLLALPRASTRLACCSRMPPTQGAGV